MARLSGEIDAMYFEIALARADIPESRAAPRLRALLANMSSLGKR